MNTYSSSPFSKALDFLLKTVNTAFLNSLFRYLACSKDLSLALALSLGRGLRRIVARVRGVLGAPPPKSSTVASCG